MLFSGGDAGMPSLCLGIMQNHLMSFYNVSGRLFHVSLARNCLGCVAVPKDRFVSTASLFPRLANISGAFFSFGWRGLGASFWFGFDRLRSNVFISKHN